VKNLENFNELIDNDLMYGNLTLLEILEIENLKMVDLKSLFNTTELKIFIASVNGTFLTNINIQADVIECHLSDTFRYEAMQILVLLDQNETLEHVLSNMLKKVSALTMFDRFVLLRWAKRFWYSRISLNDYVSAS